MPSSYGWSTRWSGRRGGRDGLTRWRIGRSLLTAPSLRERRARQSNHDGGDHKACKFHVSVSLPSCEGLSAALRCFVQEAVRGRRSSENCQLWRGGTVTCASRQAGQNPGRRLKENVHPRAASKRRTASSSKIMPAALMRTPVPTLRSSVRRATKTIGHPESSDVCKCQPLDRQTAKL